MFMEFIYHVICYATNTKCNDANAPEEQTENFFSFFFSFLTKQRTDSRQATIALFFFFFWIKSNE